MVQVNPVHRQDLTFLRICTENMADGLLCLWKRKATRCYALLCAILQEALSSRSGGSDWMKLTGGRG
jgi:hypothetical protein